MIALGFSSITDAFSSYTLAAFKASSPIKVTLKLFGVLDLYAVTTKLGVSTKEYKEKVERIKEMSKGILLYSEINDTIELVNKYPLLVQFFEE